MTEHTDEQLAAEDQLTIENILAASGEEPPPYNTLLKVWAEVIGASKSVRKERINPQWAVRVTSTHAQVFLQDMPEYRDLYYDKIDQLLEALQAEIDTDDECLNYTTVEEDLANNHAHYVNVVFSWQKLILSWELDWDCENESAAVELATIIDVHKMFFGDVGLISLFDNIGFDFSEDLQQQLFEELEELKNNWNSDE